MAEKSIPTDSKPERDALTLAMIWKAALVLALLIGVLLLLISVQGRVAPQPSACATPRVETAYARSFTVVADETRSMGKHVERVRTAVETLLSRLAPGDNLAAVYALSTRFDSAEDELLGARSAALARPALWHSDAHSLDGQCIDELRRAWSSTRQDVESWKAALKKPALSAAECSSYFSTLEGAASRARDTDASERWLVVFGDLEAESVSTKGCKRARPRDHLVDGKPFDGLRIMLAATAREAGGESVDARRDEWTEYFARGGAKDVLATSIEAFMDHSFQEHMPPAVPLLEELGPADEGVPVALR